jgi:hypothetical protein
LKAALIALIMLCGASVACSGLDDVIGQRPAKPTPTPPAFVTATPGGRISVWLVTPTGYAPGPGSPTATPYGEVVAPAATATALSATVQAATAIAATTPKAPLYQPGSECPVMGVPPPPVRPTIFSQYPETIGRYLSAGGSPALLESSLREWGAINEGAVVQADTDLTGDGTPDIIVALYDPDLFQPGKPSPGQLLVYGCAQGGYKLLFSTVYGPNTMIPELRRVGDMNGDLRAELAFTQKTCDAGKCSQVMQIYEWSGALGMFQPLNDVPINATDAKVLIADLDGDGILEVAISFNPPLDLTAGPPRKTTSIWDWNGVNYVLAVVQVEAPVYRIHMLYDADYLFGQEEWRSAIKDYDRVRDDATLQPWSVPNEPVILRAYATYKKMLAQIANGQRSSANTTFDGLKTENPPGSPGEGYVTVAQAFMDNYNKTRNRAKACAAVLSAVAARPDTLTPLNSYGANNRTYTPADLCPFS